MNLARKLQSLGKHAARLRQAVDAAPQKAARIRDAVAVTAGQFQQLRAEVQSGLESLRADNDDRLIASLREIADHRETLLEAGVELAGFEIELGVARRLIVRLQKVSDVPIPALESLAKAQSERTTLAGIFTALLRAAELSEQVEFEGLSYRELTVHLGSVPTVRVCWVTDESFEGTTTTTSAAPPRLVPTAASESSRTLSTALPQGFFDPRPTGSTTPGFMNLSPEVTTSGSPAPPIATVLTPAAPSAPAPAQASAPAPTIATAAIATAPAPVESSPPAPPPEPPAKDWNRRALDRFKKMPDLSKRA